ncbi:uncharacterized protein LOC131946372 isoform X2 [Physella acuta]|nr:uncharacterized protein LOC131946372 isoform X2 [Physella acuta]
MCGDHNHEISEAEFRLHPKQRKLDLGSQEEIANLLCMGPDKKLLRDKLMQITGKVILMKDIHNIKTRLVNTKLQSKSTLSESYDPKDVIHLSDIGDGVHVVDNPQDKVSDEIQIPLSHIPSSQVINNQSTVMIHSAQQTLNQDVDQSCYMEAQAYQQPANMFTINIQSFQPPQLYSVASQPFQTSVPSIMPVSNILQNVHSVEPTCSADHFQHWSGIEGKHSLQEKNYQPLTAVALSQTQHNEELHCVPLLNQQQTVLISPPSPIYTTLASPQDISNKRKSKRNPRVTTKVKKQRLKGRAAVMTYVKKKRKCPIQTDKDHLIKKYFQKAAVNLFFNERLNSAGNKLLKNLPAVQGISKMSEKISENKCHDLLKPLAWLFGKWRSEDGKGQYPTVSDFTYAEEVEFFPIGMKPIVEYKFYSWKPENGLPLHRETGFIRIKPETNHIAFVSAHNLGVVEIQEGEVTGQELTVETTNLGRTSFNKPPEVKTLKRKLKRIGDQLEQVIDMQTTKTEMTEHLRITFKKTE